MSALATEKHLFSGLEVVAAHAIELRHEFHRHPELGYQERLTSDLIAAELARLDIPHTRGWAGGTGIVAAISGAPSHSPTARCVALRADIDALPVSEETNAPYASTIPGAMHACGHDGHMAVLLGAAALLKQHAESFHGTVKLLFQPAEEGGLGAKRMCDEGALDNPKVDAIFGLHGWPGLKVGMVATRPGPLLASVDGFRITLTGKGGHAAAPQDCIDPILCAAACITALQSIVSREVDPNDAAVVTISQIAGGSTFNVIPDKVELNGTIRALSDARHRALLDAIERICKGVAAAHRCQVAFDYYGTTPVTANTPELADFFRETAIAALGDRGFAWAPKPAMWGEDFAFYLQHVPGCFFVLGVQPMDRDSYPMLHNPRYDFTDAAVPVGIRMMAELAVRYLAR
ncbi:MAG TPA: M20 family metallopeptidase [Phycisphaerae bacterium]|nr:M20 family metallopeptidase [Phycisphaerae bacterium]